MKASDFESATAPWVDVAKWNKWAEAKGVHISHGDRYNRTDGEIHYILKYNNASFDMAANYWDWRNGWQEAIDWIELNTDPAP